MHVGVVAFFEATSFRMESGEIDVRKMQDYVLSRIQRVPRCRQRLSRIPFLGHPIWVDDRQFSIENHVRGIALPEPGDEATLRDLAATIFSRPLDRTKPLWEVHVVQGLRDPDRFAMICKVHHAMVDGVAGMDFIASLLSAEPVADIELAPRHLPRQAPHTVRLLLDEAARVASAPGRLVRFARQLRADPATRAAFRGRVTALAFMLVRGIQGTSKSPMTKPSRPERMFGWFATDRSDERTIRARIGGSRDDVTLAVSTGAIRGLLLRNNARLHSLRIKGMAPINVRTKAQRGELGNRVSMLIVELPVHEADPRARIERIIERVAELKESKQLLGVDVLAQIDEWTGTAAQSIGNWLSARVRAANACVTNVPGPSSPLYALESQLLSMYPLAPVFDGQLFNVTALSYLDKLEWGVHYAGDDREEFERFVADLEVAFHELTAAAARTPPRIRLVPDPIEQDDVVEEAAGQ
jgi:WS/DGAT/MGAT family acyltransferase